MHFKNYRKVPDAQGKIIACDKNSLDITWLKMESLADLDNLPDPDVLAAEIVENIESALDGFRVLLPSYSRREKQIVSRYFLLQTAAFNLVKKP